MTTQAIRKSDESSTDGLDDGAHEGVRRDIWGILTGMASTLLLLALFSFSPDGSSANWVGPVGAFVADSLLFSLGIAGYAIAFFVGWLAWCLFTERSVLERPGEIAGWSVLFLCLMVSLSIVYPEARLSGHQLGGILGSAVASLFTGLLGQVGTLVLCGSGFLSSALLISGRSMRVLLDDWDERWRGDTATDPELPVDEGDAAAPEDDEPARDARAEDEFAANAGDEEAHACDADGAAARRGMVARLRRWFGRRAGACDEVDVWQEDGSTGNAVDVFAEEDPAWVDSFGLAQDGGQVSASARGSARSAARIPIVSGTTTDRFGAGLSHVDEGPLHEVSVSEVGAGGADGTHGSGSDGVAEEATLAHEVVRRGVRHGELEESGEPGERPSAASGQRGAMPASEQVRRNERALADRLKALRIASAEEYGVQADGPFDVSTSNGDSASASVRVVDAEVVDASGESYGVAHSSERAENSGDAAEDSDVWYAESSELPEVDEESGAVSMARVPTGEEPRIGPQIVESRALRERARAEDLERADVARSGTSHREARPWQFPPLRFLSYEEAQGSAIDPEEAQAQAVRLEKVFEQFKVKGRVSGIRPGPIVTMFEFEPEPGTKLNKISNLSKEVAMRLRAEKIRIIAPLPGRGCVGIEVPNPKREMVYLKEILAHDTFRKSKSKLTISLGKDIAGEPVVANLQKMPHLLVAGTTGSGKSVAVNAFITSVLYNASPDDVRMILIDPKQLELAVYEGVPHLLLPVVTDPEKAVTALNWAVAEMERRYTLMKEMKVRNLEGYNEKLRARLDRHGRPDEDIPPEALPSDLRQLAEKDDDGRWRHRHMPYLLIVIDEFADLMMTAKEVETAVARLAQKARAAGIHVILATQRPSVDVLTGLIKANFPTRMSFRLMAPQDSRTVLDTQGAEALLGQGDMLFRPPGESVLRRVHGAWVDEEEIEQVVAFLKQQRLPEYDESILASTSDASGGGSAEGADELYDKAVEVVVEEGFASISMVQRKLNVGYNRAANMVDYMEREGVIGPAVGGAKRREVLVGKHG